MFRSVTISGYRGLSEFRMSGLGRVNLLVGRNNSGKTSVLEALYLLGAAGDPMAIWRICNRRGERIVDENAAVGRRTEADVSHLFTGHEIGPGRSLSVEAANSPAGRRVEIMVVDPPARDEEDVLDLKLDLEEAGQRPLALQIRSTAMAVHQTVTLRRTGGLAQNEAEFASRRPARPYQEAAVNVHFISTESIPGNELIRLWDRIQLTQQESLVLQALRFVDPSIDQIRSVGTGSPFGPRGGFIVKRQQDLLPVPLGSLGDGAWRMLTMAIVLTQCAGGMLFIDEVDTGLHYTVMADMWRLIQASARIFDVQVFASTHSYDCVHSLSAICGIDETDISDVSIQRIESNRNSATPFTESEIRMAAERQIEIR